MVRGKTGQKRTIPYRHGREGAERSSPAKPGKGKSHKTHGTLRSAVHTSSEVTFTRIISVAWWGWNQIAVG